MANQRSTQQVRSRARSSAHNKCWTTNESWVRYNTDKRETFRTRYDFEIRYIRSFRSVRYICKIKTRGRLPGDGVGTTRSTPCIEPSNTSIYQSIRHDTRTALSHYPRAQSRRWTHQRHRLMQQSMRRSSDSAEHSSENLVAESGHTIEIVPLSNLLACVIFSTRVQESRCISGGVIRFVFGWREEWGGGRGGEGMGRGDEGVGTRGGERRGWEGGTRGWGQEEGRGGEEGLGISGTLSESDTARSTALRRQHR